MRRERIRPGISFIAARVTHARLRPTRNRFRYCVPYLAIPESALVRGGVCGLLSIDGANLFSVHMSDYGSGPARAVAWVRSILADRKIGEADGEIVLVTMPRVLGLVFNPVSFWLCCDRAGALRAVVAEVNNTFGERHFYVCRHADHRAIEPDDRLTAEKVFHVSPFMAVDGHYVFTFSYAASHLAVRIDLHDAQGLILTTSVAGVRQPVTSSRLARTFLGNPLLMLKVLGLIHYQALRLWLKGVAPLRKPLPPTDVVTG